MIEFEIRYKTQTMGDRKGQTVYYANPKTQQVMTNKMLVERIVRETSLSAGDVSNALISLGNVVCEALELGMKVDLAELGSLRLSVTSKMMNSEEEVTVANALNAPRIVFNPKQAMRNAAKSVELFIDHSRVTPAKSTSGGNTGGGGSEGGSTETPPSGGEGGGTVTPGGGGDEGDMG